MTTIWRKSEVEVSRVPGNMVYLAIRCGSPLKENAEITLDEGDVRELIGRLQNCIK